MRFRTPLPFAAGGSSRQAVPVFPDVAFAGEPTGTPFRRHGKITRARPDHSAPVRFPSHSRCRRPCRARLGDRDSAGVIDGQLMEMFAAVSPRRSPDVVAGVHRSRVSLGSRPGGKGGAAWEP